MLRRAQVANLAVFGSRFFSSAENEKKRVHLKEEVKKALQENPIFSQKQIASGSEAFFNLGFEVTYYNVFQPAMSAKHLIGFITATIESETGKAFEYSLEHGENPFWLCENNLQSVLRTQRRIEAFLTEKKLSDPKSRRGVSLRTYHSESGNTVLFSLILGDFKAGAPSTFTKIEEVSTTQFLQARTAGSQERYGIILKELATSLVPVFRVREVEGGLAITVGINPDLVYVLSGLTTLFSSIPGATISKSFLETFSGGQQVYTFFVRGATREVLEATALQIGMLPNNPAHPITRLYEAGKLSPLESTYAKALTVFAFYFTPPITSHDYRHVAAALAKDDQNLKVLKKMRAELQAELLTEEYIGAIFEKHVDFAKRLYKTFEAGLVKPGSLQAFYDEVQTLTDNEVERAVLATFVRFNESVAKTNFFKVKRAAAAFRLDPNVFIKNLDFPAVPFGVFLVVGAQFRGFHVRFADIARGGIRMVLSQSVGPKYYKNRRTLFQENYNLAHTQMLKNKDICESGSKGVILVSPRRQPEPKMVYMQYVDALLDVLLPGESGVRDSLPNREILFLGPDENTSGELPSDAAYHARDRGYKEWKSFTTGKGQDIGGIPHEIYGMTTESVRANVLSIYKEKGITDQTKLTKFQTGGPDGDLGSNEIMLSSEKYLGVVDKSGVLYDPEGLNKEELVRLAKGRPNLTVKDFDQSKLSPKGFFVGEKETHRTLPDGTHVASGEKFRDEFHFTNYVTCDVFVPCGGRPAAVTLENVHRLLVGCPETFTGETMLYGKLGDLASQGKTRFKYIVEGANLFITQDARLALENVGVVLVKDSAANKGGVTSSSFEVLAGLSLSAEEHDRLMCVKNGVFPEFYNKMVQEIVERIRANAVREYQAVSVEVAKGRLDGKRTLISDELSRRIVQMRTTIIQSDLFDNIALRKLVLKKYVPQVLQAQVPIDKIIERVPENYLRACFSVYIASNYVYSTGLGATEFEFFQYMNKLHAEAASA